MSVGLSRGGRGQIPLPEPKGGEHVGEEKGLMMTLTLTGRGIPMPQAGAPHPTPAP